jgi:hypothetical protein
LRKYVPISKHLCLFPECGYEYGTSLHRAQVAASALVDLFEEELKAEPDRGARWFAGCSVAGPGCSLSRQRFPVGRVFAGNGGAAALCAYSAQSDQ